jgi:N,N'-diacetyllegionaminate synthase
LTTKRPGDGISAMQYDAWLGRVADRDYEADELIRV